MPRDEDTLHFLLRRSVEEAVIAIGSVSSSAAIVHEALSTLYAARARMLLRRTLD